MNPTTSTQTDSPPRTGTSADVTTSPTLPSQDELIDLLKNDPDALNLLSELLHVIDVGVSRNVAESLGAALKSRSNIPSLHILLRAVIRSFGHTIKHFNAKLNSQSALHSSQLTSAMQQSAPSQQPAPAKTPTAQDLGARRKLLSERMPILHKGVLFENYKRSVGEVLLHEGAIVTEMERLAIVQKACMHDTEIAVKIDSAYGNKLYTSTIQYLHDLSALFKPDHFAYREAIKSKRQRHNQTASDYIAHIKKLGSEYWVGIPASHDVFVLIVETMTKEHQSFIMQQLNLSQELHSRTTDARALSFNDLERWAHQSDLQHLHKNKDGKDKQSGSANNAEGDTRGRGRFRGRGRRGGRQQGHSNYSNTENAFNEFVFMTRVTQSDSDEDISIGGEVGQDLPTDFVDASARKHIPPAYSTRSSRKEYSSVLNAIPNEFHEVDIQNTKRKLYVPPPLSRQTRARFVKPSTSSPTKTSSHTSPPPRVSSPDASAVPYGEPLQPAHLSKPQPTGSGTVPSRKRKPRFPTSLPPALDTQVTKRSLLAIAKQPGKLCITKARPHGTGVSSTLETVVEVNKTLPPVYFGPAPVSGPTLHSVPDKDSVQSPGYDVNVFIPEAKPIPSPDLTVNRSPLASSVVPRVSECMQGSPTEMASGSQRGPSLSTTASPTILQSNLGINTTRPQRAPKILGVTPPPAYNRNDTSTRPTSERIAQQPLRTSVKEKRLPSQSVKVTPSADASREPLVPPTQPFTYPPLRVPFIPVDDSRPPHWPETIKPHPITHGAFGGGFHESYVVDERGIPLPYGSFTPILKSAPLHVHNEIQLARFARSTQSIVEPIWVEDLDTPTATPLPAYKGSMPVHRMITIQTIKDRKPIMATVTPQVTVTPEGHFRFTVLNQDSADPTPHFDSYVVDIDHLIQHREQIRAQHHQPLHSLGAKPMSPLDNMLNHVHRATESRKNYDENFLSKHRADLLFLKNTREMQERDKALRERREFTNYIIDEILFPVLEKQEADKNASAVPVTPTRVPDTCPTSSPQVSCNMLTTTALSGAFHDTQAQANAVRQHRPPNAEPYRQMDNVQRVPPPVPYFHKPESRIGSATFTISFAGLSHLFDNPHFANFMSALKTLLQNPHTHEDRDALGNLARALSDVAAELNVPLACLLDLQSSGGGRVHTNHAAEPSNAILPQLENLISIFTPALQVADQTQQALQVPFIDAAIAQVATVTQPTASMPAFKYGVMSKQGKLLPNVTRVAYFDTGCNVNLMSRRALERDIDFLGPDAKVVNIKPFNVNLADGKTQTLTITAVQDVRMVIGKGWYLASFLVVDNLATDCLIGMPFMLRYDVQIKPHRSNFVIGLTSKNLVNPDHNPPGSGYQFHDLQINTKRITLVAV